MLALMVSAPLMAADLTAYTEEWPPYNYAERGEVKGIATDVLRAVCAEAKVSCEFHLVPWARALAMASNTPNTLVYTTARKPSREHEFLWVGPLLPRTTWIYGKKERAPTIKNFTDLAQHRVGVVRGEASVQDLVAAGVPETSMVVDSSNAAVLKLLSRDWVDAMVDTEIGMAWNVKLAQIPPADFVKLMKLADNGAYYFALNLKSDASLHDKLQRATDKLRKNGSIDRIVGNYAHRNH
jgi:polar amino acid transport system substrate-binding protein